MNIVATALASSAGFIRLALRHSLKLRAQRLGKLYAVADGNYMVFRETENTSSEGEVVILVIGFRLKLLGASCWPHWLFQRICILTTPFWSGLPGFRTKLWMVDPATKNYLGIYDWRGTMQADNYVRFLLPVLRFFSVGGTVWAAQLHGRNFEDFLQRCSG